MKTNIQLTDQELATVLHALRHVQNVLENDPDGEPLKGEHFTDVKPLNAEQIDALCEEINTSGPLKIIVEVSGGVVDPVHVSHEAVVTVYDHDNIEAGDEAPCNLEEATAELPHTY